MSRRAMKRAMIFIDFENLDASRKHLIKECGDYSYVPFLDIEQFPHRLIEELKDADGLEVEPIKTFLFAPKPEDFLMDEDWRAKRFNFLQGLERISYLSVIFGEHVARPINGGYYDRDINDKSTYYVTEKGTDVNIATNLLTKAFHNSYDVAIVVSGDTDYIPVYDVLNSMGKIVVVVAVEGQNLYKIEQYADLTHKLDMSFFETCMVNKED